MFRRAFAALKRIFSRLFRALFGWIPRLIRSTHHLFTEELVDRPAGDALQNAMENPGLLLVHVDALRKHLLRTLLVFAAATGLAFTFSKQILEFLTIPLDGGVEALMAIEITEPLSTLMRISLLTGFALALPYLAFEFWLFFAPGLHRRSRLLSLLAIPAVLIFFVAGMAFTYYIILPTAVPFLLGILDLPTQVRPASYIGFTTGLMFWIGIAFEFPLVIFLLASLGWLHYKTLIQQWRLAVVIIAVASALITPTIDPVNMSLVMAPLLVLYILSIFLAYIASSRRERRQVAESA